MITYSLNPQITLIHGKIPLAQYQEGGKVILDQKMAGLALDADGRKVEEILRLPQYQDVTPKTLNAALASLAESQILLRSPNTEDNQIHQDAHLSVSVVIVTHNAGKWLDECITSTLGQTCHPEEIIVVDNASTDRTVAEIHARYSSVKLILLSNQVPYATALNVGIRAGKGRLFLLINQDIKLEPDMLMEMVRDYQANPGIGAVVPKIFLYHTPPFLNGIGNQVGTVSWGWDNALGHLDLGQFDTWQEVPSACFAAVLIPHSAFDKVGLVDE